MDRWIRRKGRGESRARFNKHSASSRQTHRSHPANTDDLSNTEPATAYIQTGSDGNRQTGKRIQTERAEHVLTNIVPTADKHTVANQQTPMT